MMRRPVIILDIDDDASMNAFSEERLKLPLMGKPRVRPAPMFPRPIAKDSCKGRACQSVCVRA